MLFIFVYGEYVEDSRDVFIYFYKQRGEDIWAFKVWAKMEGLLLNLRGNICSNANDSLKNQGSVLKFNIQVNNNIKQQNIEKNFENSNVWARYEYLKLRNSQLLPSILSYLCRISKIFFRKWADQSFFVSSLWWW